MDPQFVIIAGLALLVLAIGVQLTYHYRSRSMVKKWAEKNGWRLMYLRKSMFRKGPFWFSGKSRPVYRLMVMDGEGVKHEGWVRCGSLMLGILSDQVEVEWD